MRILWSLPVRGERLGSGRGDLVRAKSLIEAMRQVGHEVHAVECGSYVAVAAYRRFLSSSLPRRTVLAVRDAGRWASSVGHARRVVRHAAEWGPDAIVETQVGFCFSGALAAQRTGLPLILDDCSPSCEENALGAGLPCLAHRALRRQARAASWLFASSRSIAESLRREGIPQEKIRLLPNGVDLEAFTGLDRERTRQRLGIADRCVIGFAGSFQVWHETRLLVAALDHLRSLAQWHLLLVGDGPARAKTLQAARELGLESRITATGEVPPGSVPELIACFDIGVLPGSNDYGHPMKLVEYAAAGVASVAPDLPPVRDVVKNLQTGLLFPTGAWMPLARRLQILLRNDGLRRRMGERARRSVTLADDWRARSSELATALELMTAGSRCVRRRSMGVFSKAPLVSHIPQTGASGRGGNDA
jgi:glycosyltransferase involved in cell wall biosynthesis